METDQMMKIVTDHITHYPKVNAALLLLLCKEHDIAVKDFSGTMYKLLSSVLNEGESKGFQGTYNTAQLEMGIIVESEHTTCSLIAAKIARDHLAEIPDYYNRLLVMETKALIDKQK